MQSQRFLTILGLVKYIFSKVGVLNLYTCHLQQRFSACHQVLYLYLWIRSVEVRLILNCHTFRKILMRCIPVFNAEYSDQCTDQNKFMLHTQVPIHLVVLLSIEGRQVGKVREKVGRYTMEVSSCFKNYIAIIMSSFKVSITGLEGVKCCIC